MDSNDVADYPNPDLMSEVDLSPSKIDRPGIYRALEVAEFWRLMPVRCRSSSSALMAITLLRNHAAFYTCGPMR